MVVFSIDDIEKIKKGLRFPFVRLSRGCLGGDSLFILVSFDYKENWVNGIVENSKYMRFILDSGKIEHFSGSGKFRKCKYLNIDDIIKKLNKYYDDNKGVLNG